MIGEVIGEGDVFAGSEHLSRVHYRMFDDQVNQQISGTMSIISGLKGRALFARNGPLTLHLEDGRQLNIVVQSSTGTLSDTWDIIGTGPIRDFNH